VVEGQESEFAKLFALECEMFWSSQSLSTSDLWQKWNGTSKLQWKELPITSTYRTGVWYERETLNGQVYEGVFHFKSYKPHLFSSSPIALYMYVFEELDATV
jgi:hypothetical protein